LRTKLAHDIKNLASFADSKCSRGLIHDDDPTSLCDCPSDCHGLSLAAGEHANRNTDRRHPNPQRLKLVCGVIVQAPIVDELPANRDSTEVNIRRDVQDLDKGEILKHGRDACV
jgi:hypothetical protein